MPVAAAVAPAMTKDENDDGAARAPSFGSVLFDPIESNQLA